MDTTERLHFHFSLSCIGEGNGNPLQCSCLENPKDGGAWWASVYGVAQSRTRLKRLSSSSSSSLAKSQSISFIHSFARFLFLSLEFRTVTPGIGPLQWGNGGQFSVSREGRDAGRSLSSVFLQGRSGPDQDGMLILLLLCSLYPSVMPPSTSTDRKSVV